MLYRFVITLGGKTERVYCPEVAPVCGASQLASASQREWKKATRGLLSWLAPD